MKRIATLSLSLCLPPLCCVLAPSPALGQGAPWVAEMSTAQDGLVSLAWPTRGGYGYRLETSPDLAGDSWQPLATFHGTGGTRAIPVARFTLPGAQPPPPAPPVDLRSAHFVLRTFAGLNKTLVVWNQPGQTGLSQVLLNADFSTVTGLPLFFGKFEDPANATDYLLSFLILGSEFDPAYDLLTPAQLNPEETERLAWFTDRLAEVKAAMEFAQANGQATNNAPATGAGSGGPGARVFFRIVEVYQDSDGDGILDHHEGDATGSDPWDSDSDNDGFSDGEEFAAGADPHDANSTPANHAGGPSGSDLPPDEDQDGDTLPNALDADPLDFHVDWERRPFPNFVVLPIPSSGGLVPAAVNNKGQVVLNAEETSPGGPSMARHWMPGMESPVALKLGPEPESPLTLAPKLFTGYDAVGKPLAVVTTLTLTDIIARDINDQGVIVGEGRFTGPSPATTTAPTTPISTPDPGSSVTVALRWANAQAAPSPVHPGFADMTQPSHNWGDLLLDSAATKLNESGMIVGHAKYRTGAPGQAPPFLASPPVPNYWSPSVIGTEGASLYDPAEIPIPAPTITGLHRVNDEFTGGTGGSSAAYWNVWTETPAHVFPEAGAASVAVATVPNGREAIAGTNRLMLFSKGGRWEPALRNYSGGFDLTEDGTVWVIDDQWPVLWHPMEKVDLDGNSGSQNTLISDVYDVASTGVAVGENIGGNVILLPSYVAADSDRNGEIAFGKDTTTPDKRFAFWINDDRDIEHAVDLIVHFPGDEEEDDVTEGERAVTDCDQPGIHFRRDLEDLTRLWIDMRSLEWLYEDGTPSFQLKARIDSAEGSPSLTLFQPVETDGGRAYLTDEDTGGNQLQDDFGQNLCTVTVGSVAVEVPPRAFDSLSSEKALHFLFEGKTAGKGNLVFEIHKSGQLLAKLPSFHFELGNANEMYETWTVGDVTSPEINDQHNNYSIWPASTATQETGQSLSEPEIREEKDYILFVHGWNMSPPDKTFFADTMFKRLWHQGYKGRFAAYRWPTFYTESVEVNNFNGSEERAWSSAAPLAALIQERSQIFEDDGTSLVRIFGHSMGNIVCSEALRSFGSSAPVHTYISGQAALAAHCWDATNPSPMNYTGFDSNTANIYRAYWQPAAGTDSPSQWETDGRPSYMHSSYMPGNVNYVNHFNEADWALNNWELNQKLKPFFDYGYGWVFGTPFGSPDNFFHHLAFQSPHTLFCPTDRFEIFSWASESRSFATGADGLTQGMMGSKVDLDSDFDFGENHKGHSAQFRSTIQKRWTYWTRFLEDNAIEFAQ